MSYFLSSVLLGSSFIGSPFRTIGHQDQPSWLFSGRDFEDNILSIAQTLPMQARGNLEPWSDISWGFEKGLIAARYRSSRYEKLQLFPSRRSFIAQYSATNILRNGTQEELNSLSPAEKYDALFSESQMTNGLARGIWDEATRTYDRGTLASWMGICEGWAAASVVEQEAIKPFVVKLDRWKRDLTFYPHDVKALTALAWSSFMLKTPVVGSRCSTLNPPVACWDNNPATVFLAVINMLGRGKQNLFIDRNMDEAVWNSPVFAYSYSFYNVLDGKTRNSLNEALTPLIQYRNDPFASKRDPNASSVVGVKMNILIAKNKSLRSDQGSVKADLEERPLNFDLEISQQGKILGGEWLGEKNFSDFLWSLPPIKRPMAQGELSLLWPSDIRLGSSLGSDIDDWALTTGSKLQVFSRVIGALLEKGTQP